MCITCTGAGIYVDLVFNGTCKQPLPPSETAIGIDLGATEQVATSDGERISGVDDTERRSTIRKRSRAVARSKKGSRRRKKCAKALCEVHRKRHVSKRNACHRQSTRLVHEHGTIVAEEQNIGNMVRSAKGTITAPGTNVKTKPGLNRSIPGRSWELLLGQLAYKAERAGRKFKQVCPAYTWQLFHRCAVVDTRIARTKGTRASAAATRAMRTSTRRSRSCRR